MEEVIEKDLVEKKHDNELTENGWRVLIAIDVTDIKHIENLLATEVTRERLQRFLSMHKNHSVLMIQKIFC